MARYLVKDSDKFTITFTHWLGGWVGPRAGLDVTALHIFGTASFKLREAVWKDLSSLYY